MVAATRTSRVVVDSGAQKKSTTTSTNVTITAKHPAPSCRLVGAPASSICCRLRHLLLPVAVPTDGGTLERNTGSQRRFATLIGDAIPGCDPA